MTGPEDKTDRPPYAEDEASFNAAMEQAEADIAAGRTLSNEEVFAEVRAIIAARRKTLP